MPLYNERVYHLDLCTLAYQLHAQTLIWPMDPYYEQMWFNLITELHLRGSEDEDLQKILMKERRRVFMDGVRTTFRASGQPSPYRGPGSCVGGNGWDTNDELDPILSDYTRLYPWRPAFTRPAGVEEPWIVYNTPTEITDRISNVYMVQFAANSGPNLPPSRPGQLPQVPGVVVSAPITRNPPSPNATDLLYCFEGGTGAIGDAVNMRKYAAWSMMGYVLAEQTTNTSYDVHVVFRGSRSGRLRFGESFSGEKGNPDWVTDMDLLKIVKNTSVSEPGKVCRGFSTSLSGMLPTIIKCLEEIDRAKGGPPTNIYVTGHSLGGALATHFTSAMMLGADYGRAGQGPRMPQGLQGNRNLRAWPWNRQHLNLLAFSAPEVGNEKFKDSFNARVASQRIRVYSDLVTTEFKSGYMGTKRITILATTPPGVSSPMEAHEPYMVRRKLINYYKLTSPTGYPAINAVGADSGEPWQVHKTCRDTLEHLSHASGGNLQGCLPNSAPLLRAYLNRLGAALKVRLASSPTGYAPPNAALVDQLINRFVRATQFQPNNPTTLQALYQVWQNERPRLLALNVDLSNFVGWCLILAYLGQFPPPQASPVFFDRVATPDFYNLLDR